MLCFQVAVQFARIEEIIFDCISRTGNVCFLEPANRMHKIQLHIKWQAGGNAVGVQLTCIQTFGFNKNLVAVALSEADYLVLDGRAIPRADPFDHTRVHW